jgi:beta-N-acetylhexosaminidase
MSKRKVASVFILFSIFSTQLLIAQDSLDIKIGQMILIGFPQPKVDQRALNAIKSGKAGSIIFFEMNLPAKNTYLETKKIVWTYQQAAKIPLFVAIDQEGGKVNRLKEKYGFPQSVSAGKLGKYALDSIRFYSEMIAGTLSGLGFNVNFAPVVDLASNPTNPIIAKVERAYSANPDSVALFAEEFIKAHQKLGIVTVLKHFPGHGSSKDDTHLGIADVTKTWTNQELIPYKKLIESNRVDAIMTAHIVNKNLDSLGLPGTLSKNITTGLLREELGYNGVIFSDDFHMNAIAEHYSREEAIRLAIMAGVDILLFSREYDIDKVHGIIRKLVESGEIPKERIDQSFRRIMELKAKMTGSSAEFYRKELVKSKKETAQVIKENERLAREAVEQAKRYQQQNEEVKKSSKKKKTKD